MKELLSAIVAKLRDSARASVTNPNNLDCSAHVRVYVPENADWPIAAGSLLNFDETSIVLRGLEETIRCQFADCPESEGKTARIELSWRSYPNSGYYGETMDEYGGEPMHLPKTVACESIVLQKECKIV